MSSDLTTPGPGLALRALRGAGLDVLPIGPDPISGGPQQLLVRQRDAAVARGIVERLDWRHAWPREGLLRLHPSVTYGWEAAPDLELCWSVPAGPLPFGVARLTRLLWRTALLSGSVHAPDPAALLVHRAVQALRPGRRHEADWRAFRAMIERVDSRTALRYARMAGVGPGLARALRAADEGEDRLGAGALLAGPAAAGWRVACAAQARAPSGRVRRMLAGSPSFGDTTIRVRAAGIEVRAGRGVFVPAPESGLLVDVALDELAATRDPVVLEAGTGCGVLALALATRRPDAEVHATERSAAAIRSARANARALGIGRVSFHHGSLLDPLPSGLRGRASLVFADLPYIPPDERLTIGSVPSSTIHGSGADGLDLLRALARDARPCLLDGGRLVLQMLGWQWERLAPDLSALGYVPGPSRSAGAFAVCVARLAPIGGDDLTRR